MRGLVAVVVVGALAGCRLHFDEHALADASGDVASGDGALADAGPLALACNTPVALSSGTSADPHLTAVTINGDQLGALWLDDLGQVEGLDATLVTPDSVRVDQTLTMSGGSGGTCSMLSAAVVGTTGLVACGSTDLSSTGYSALETIDTTTSMVTGSSMTSSIRVASPRGLTSVGNAFVLGGVAFNPTVESAVVGLDTTGATIAPLSRVVAGSTNERVAAQPNGTVIAVAFGAAIPCTARLYASGTVGPAATWGSAGMCLEPIAIPSTDNTSILLVRKDTSDGDLNHQIATVSGQSLTLPGEGKLSSVADEPRGIAIGTGYWVGYHTAAGMLEAIAVDATGTKGTPHTLGPVPSIDAHDLVAVGGEPYAVWFSNGLQLAHLCP